MNDGFIHPAWGRNGWHVDSQPHKNKVAWWLFEGKPNVFAEDFHSWKGTVVQNPSPIHAPSMTSSALPRQAPMPPTTPPVLPWQEPMPPQLSRTPSAMPWQQEPPSVASSLPSEAGGNNQFEAGAHVTFSGFTYSSARETGELQTGQSASSGSTPSATHTVPAGSTSTSKKNKIR